MANSAFIDLARAISESLDSLKSRNNTIEAIRDFIRTKAIEENLTIPIPCDEADLRLRRRDLEVVVEGVPLYSGDFYDAEVCGTDIRDVIMSRLRMGQPGRQEPPAPAEQSPEPPPTPGARPVSPITPLEDDD